MTEQGAIINHGDRTGDDDKAGGPSQSKKTMIKQGDDERVGGR